MTSPDDGDSNQPQVASSFSTPDVRSARIPFRNDSPESSSTNLPPNPLASRNSTLSGTLSRSGSPNGRLSISLGRFGRSSSSSPLATASENNDNTRSSIVRSFSPTVGVSVSPETDELVRRKGVKHGFAGLIRPYGERIPGKVVVRDSVGASRSWDDFGVKFTDLRHLIDTVRGIQPGQILDNVEDILDQYLQHNADEEPGNGPLEMSPYYRLFISRLLSSQPISSHETFLHPVATVIAISSSTPTPIETLRDLYTETAQGSRTLPVFTNPEYLRYYVLVHDDDRDDFSKSSALFDQMKRHFGLHCHLLRLRSIQCTNEDEDTEELPACEWFSASEELLHLQDTADLIDLNSPTQPQVFTSDAVAIRTFIRELTAQSVIPHMEQRISLWNDQIASRRRGISGKFMSLSKRWGGIGGLGSSSRSPSSLMTSSTSSSGNYDSVQALYRWDTPEALLRKLADFAVMLRDYKLAASTYELLRSDYSNDKAWKYLAGANEMCCVSTLLNPLASSSSKTLKIESFDQMLETASYSYLTHCRDPTLALRAILLGVELLKVRGRAANELAAKWAIRCLESNLVASTTISHVLITERIVSCLASQPAIGYTAPTTSTKPNTSQPLSWGTRKRKAAMWSILAAEEWHRLGRAELAATRLDEGLEFYDEVQQQLKQRSIKLYITSTSNSDTTKTVPARKQYDEMAEFTHQLQATLKMKVNQAVRRKRGLSSVSTGGGGGGGGGQNNTTIATGRFAEAEDALAAANAQTNAYPRHDAYTRGSNIDNDDDEEMDADAEHQLEKLDTKPHRRSVMGGPGNRLDAMPPLSPVRLNRPDPLLVRGDDDFE